MAWTLEGFSTVNYITISRRCDSLRLLATIIQIQNGWGLSGRNFLEIVHMPTQHDMCTLKFCLITLTGKGESFRGLPSLIWYKIKVDERGQSQIRFILVVRDR